MMLLIGNLSNDDGDVKENGNNAIGLDQQNNNFARASRFFVHFFAVVARLQRESASFQQQQQQLSFSFSAIWYSPLEFNSKKICQHLTN